MSIPVAAPPPRPIAAGETPSVLRGVVVRRGMTWKPDGYSSVSPYLIVRDAEATLRFAEAVFGATRLRVHRRAEGGGIEHAEARIDDTVIMTGEMPDAGEAHVHVYVPDAEATFARAVEAGGTVVQELRRSGDGDHRGGGPDGNGTVWWISTQEEHRDGSGAVA